ncbi:MAG: LacI family DNA-binding transcriptional regulator [Succinivibrio sp.]|nr:LacI family DNA-binding transcriptional regulator [Succinivibrio sp.]
MAHATLKTIAEYTGLSVTTVSRALKDGDDVKAPTKEKVKKAAQELGYAPNLSGLSLRTGLNYSVCAILPTVKDGDVTGDIGTLQLISGLTAAFDNTAYHLTVLPLKEGEDPLIPVKFAVESNLAGGIIFNLTRTNDERVTYLNEKKVPFVTFGQTEMSVDHAYVDVDNYDIGYRAASHLFSLGCKRIALLSSQLIYTYAWHKYYGVKRASMEYGVPFDKERDIIIDSAIKDYRKFIRQLYSGDNAPDGLICGSEISAIGVMSGLQDAGRHPGEDVKLICVETSDLSSLFTPPIPGLRQDFYSVGNVLARYIIKLIEGGNPAELKYIEKATLYEH